jgi:hypothetical protein
MVAIAIEQTQGVGSADRFRQYLRLHPLMEGIEDFKDLVPDASLGDAA